MYSKILLAADGSPTSQRALDDGIALTRALGAQLTIVHVALDLPTFADWPAALLEQTRAATLEDGRKLLEDARQRAARGGVEAGTRLIEEFGSTARIAEAVAREARDAGASLIIAGTHGRRGLNRVLLGSVAEELLRIAPVPVLLVRSEPEAPPRRSRPFLDLPLFPD